MAVVSIALEQESARSGNGQRSALERTLLLELIMNHLKTWTIAALLSAPLGACSQTDMMGGGDADMHAALADAEAENQRHADACDAAPSMPDMLSELDRHDGSMSAIMERMDGARGRMGGGFTGMGMQHCTGPTFEHMSETLDDMHSVMSEHVGRMRAAEELDAARSECSTHTDAMGDMMQSMMSDVESMSCAR